MARKIATGDTKPEQCFNISTRIEYKQNLQKIKQLLREGIEIRAKGTIIIEDTGITYIHPCISETGKVTAEARLKTSPEGTSDLKYGFYDPIQLCTIMNITDFFKDTRCSPNLGVGRATIDDKTALIYKDGRINVRKAKDKEDAIQTIRLISRSLWGAIICSYCGNASIDCASGGCEECITRICPVISGGPPDPTVTSRSMVQQTSVSTIFGKVKILETKEYFEEGIRQLDDAFDIFEKTSLNILKKQPFNSSALKTIKDKIAEINKLAIKFIVETPDVYDAAIGLILSGVAMDITRMADGLKIVTSSKKALSPNLKELFSEAVTLATEAYHAFKAVNFEKAEHVAERYVKFRKQWMEAFREMSEKDVLIGIEKIAINGFYLSRLLIKPLPT